MTDESDLLRRLIKDEVARHLERRQNQPRDAHWIGERIAEEVIRRLERMGAQVVSLHTNPRESD